jgi:hypothetical protein
MNVLHGAEVLADQPHSRREIANAFVVHDLFRWQEAGQLADLLAAGGDERAAQKLRRCHDPNCGWVEFCSVDPGHHLRFHPERCWLRVCPSCAKALAQRLRDRYEGRIKAVVAANVQGWSLKMVTLTAKREGDLKAQLLAIHKATKKLVKHFWTRANKKAGAFATFEVGPQGGNVHVHVIVYGGYVKKQKLSDYWRKLTGNYIVDIGMISIEKAVAEGIKYIAKFAKDEKGDARHGAFVLPMEDLAALHFVLKGKRRAWSWGAFYGLDVDVEEEPDPEAEAIKAGQCPKCGAPLAMDSISAIRQLLDLTAVIKCSVERATGPPGEAVGEQLALGLG